MTRNRAEAAALAAYNELSGPRAGSQAPSRRNFQNSVQVAEPGRVRVGVPSARTRWRNEPPAEADSEPGAEADSEPEEPHAAWQCHLSLIRPAAETSSSRFSRIRFFRDYDD